MTAPPLKVMVDRAQREIVKARVALEAETPVGLHTHHAPKLTEADGAITKYPDEGGIGLPFSAPFHRVLAYAERDRPHPETAVRWAYSTEMVAYCRTNHPEHIPSSDAKPLCAQLVYLAVWCGKDPDEIAQLTPYPAAQIRTLLIGALTHAAQWRAALYRSSGPLESASANESLEVRLLREHDVVHEERTWRLHQAKYDLRDWPEELADRRARHKYLRCSDCPLLAEAA